MATGEHDHGHDHGSGEAHDHPGMAEDVELSDRAKRLLAMEELLVEKGVIGRDDVRRVVDVSEARSPADGARVVAHAWADPDYRRRLLEDPTAALAELGYPLIGDTVLTVVENTDEVHNIVVCTLCSCYPWPLLGIPPGWYKSDAYRARVVREPRKVLAEFGVDLPADTAVRVWDSTAEVRYLVIPQRPAGSEGLDVAALADLVTRDSMIGTGLAKAP